MRKEEKTHLRDQDMIRLVNKTLNLALGSTSKGPNFYGNTTRQVVYHDLTYKYDRNLSVPFLEEQKTETLDLTLYNTQETVQSLLSIFRVIKLRNRIDSLPPQQMHNVKGKVVTKYFESQSEDSSDFVKRGDAVLLKCEANNLYLGIKRYKKQNAVLSFLENSHCEFVFILDTKRNKDLISFDDSFQIKSLLGVSITINSNSNAISIEELIYPEQQSKTEDEMQLKIEETLKMTYRQQNLSNELQLVCNSLPVNYSLKFFNCEKLSQFESYLVQELGNVFEKIVEFHFFFQYWGNTQGKLLKTAMANEHDEYSVRIQEELDYYVYEEAKESQDKLSKKSNKLCQILRKLYRSMMHGSYISNFNWIEHRYNPELSLIMHQKAMLDLDMFQYLSQLIKLLMQKLYFGTDFETIFGIKHDVDRKKDPDSSTKKISFKRLLLHGELDWKKLRYSPQYICKSSVENIVAISLRLLYLGVKNNAKNIENISQYMDQFFYLFTFFPLPAKQILLEVAKYKVFKNESHIVNWISKIEVLGERSNNLDDQITVLSILNNLCTDYGMGKDTLSIQKRIRIQLFNIGTNPKKRGVMFFQPESTISYQRYYESISIPAEASDKSPKNKEEQLLLQSKPTLRHQNKDDSQAKCYVKIFRPSNLPDDHIRKRIPFFTELGFEFTDKTRFSWDLFINRPVDPAQAAVYDRLIILVNEYIQLMIKMSESMNDESLNQVKNIGLNEDFCMFFIRRSTSHPKIKSSLLQLFSIIHLSNQQRSTDWSAFCFQFDKLDKLSLLCSPLETLATSQSDTADLQEKRKLEEFITQFTSGEFTKPVDEILVELLNSHDVTKDYLNLIENLMIFIAQVVSMGYSDMTLNNHILNLLSDVLSVLVNKSDHGGWICKIIGYSCKNRLKFDLQLRSIVSRVLDTLILLAEHRTNIQVMAYLRYFRETYDNIRKFRCRISFVKKLFEIYDFNQWPSPAQESTSKRNIFQNQFTQRAKTWQIGEKINKVHPAPKVHNQNMSLADQLETLRELKYPFMDLCMRLYYSVDWKSSVGGADERSDKEKVNTQIQSKIFQLFQCFYLERERFFDHLQRVLLFIGMEEIMVISDFEGESRSTNQQVVSVVRLREKISQILLDDLSIHNQLHNTSLGENKQRRILELTNIINKIIGKFTERLFQPRLFTKTQDLLRVLDFHGILMDIFKISYTESRHKMMFTKALTFFEYFIFQNHENTLTLVPYTQIFIDLIGSDLPTSRILVALLQQFTTAVIKTDLLKNIYERICKLVENPQIFQPNAISGHKDQGFLDNIRSRLIKYFRILRALLVQGSNTYGPTQLLFVENLMFCYSLSMNLIPANLELLTQPDSFSELSKGLQKSSSLLNLLYEFYTLINLSIVDNRNSLLVVISLLDQACLKNLILNESLHPILKVQFVGNDNLDKALFSVFHLCYGRTITNRQ